jgi:hypothetical protein
MSIYVNVKINENTVMDLQIGSSTWPQELDDVVEYAVTTKDDIHWQNSIPFKHRFGDGIAVCVQKALWVIVNNKDVPNSGQEW